jgi:hypothetical protein
MQIKVFKHYSIGKKYYLWVNAALLPAPSAMSSELAQDPNPISSRGRHLKLEPADAAAASTASQ